MKELRAGSWRELYEHLFADAWNERLRLFRSNFAFRGRPDATNELSTSLARLTDNPASVERPLVRHFRKYAARDAVPVDSLWNWLSLAQHHGLPTRLLDWTYSPEVALHFATAKTELAERDAVVWMVDYVRAHELAPKKLRQQLDGEAANVFTTEMIAAVASDFDQLSKLGDDFVVFVEPPSFDDRIVNQYALFSLMSEPEASLDAWIREHGDLARKVVIPAELKWEVRDKLDQSNVTERVLFPGLDGLSRWLARYYMPRRR